MKALFSLIFIFSTFYSLEAQHCPFDYVAILVLEVRDGNSDEKVRKLRIQLKDEHGKSLMNGGKEVSFVQNPESTFSGWLQDEKRELRYAFNEIRYGFAEDNYILPLSWEYADTALWMHIEDPSGKYESKVLQLRKENYFDLHENVGLWTELYQKKESPKVEFNKLIQISLAAKD